MGGNRRGYSFLTMEGVHLRVLDAAKVGDDKFYLLATLPITNGAIYQLMTTVCTEALIFYWVTIMAKACFRKMYLEGLYDRSEETSKGEHLEVLIVQSKTKGPCTEECS